MYIVLLNTYLLCIFTSENTKLNFLISLYLHISTLAILIKTYLTVNFE